MQQGNGPTNAKTQDIGPKLINAIFGKHPVNSGMGILFPHQPLLSATNYHHRPP